MLDIRQNVSLSDYTTLKIGGPANFFTEVETSNQLVEAVQFAKEQQIPWIVIGGGSNLLISDEGFPGIIIKFSLNGISIQNDLINVKAGTNLQQLVDFTIQNELDGMSTMTGIPGTVGGAIYGSAGAYGDNIRDFLIAITYLDTTDFQSKTIKKDQFLSAYRDSIFKKQKDWIILEAKFSGFNKGNKTAMEKECAEVLAKRTVKYPPQLKCPGSFFKNIIADQLSAEQLNNIPQDKIIFGKIPAGYLLESIGAKGLKLGNIKVADNHANTFINLGNGTAFDFYQLAKNLADEVYKKYNIQLEPEVQFINLPPFRYD